MYVRWMIRRDMHEVVALDDEWPEDEYLRLLRQRNCIGMVAELGERVVGAMVYEMHKGRLTVLRMTGAPGPVGAQAIATMSRKLVGKLSPHGRTVVDYEVNEGDMKTLKLLRQEGWKATGVLRDHFDGRDAIVMSWRLQEVPLDT